MNSLEFINAEIIKWQEILESFREQLTRVKGTRNEETTLNHIKANELKLQYLQQIKAELEAWYVCKQNAHINKYENINKKRKENRFDITIWLNTENCGFKSCASYEDCLKVRKALEVKDENN